VREARHVKVGTTSWWQFIRTAKSPELPVVLLEDIGAEIGLVLALAGVTLAAVTHDPRWDAVGSIAIGLLLIAIGILLAIETKALLVGESAATESEEAIKSAIAGHPAVRKLIHLRTEHIGPDVLLVGAKIEFANESDLPGLASQVNAVEAAIRAAEPAARWIYLEPDLFRSAGGT
jgi:divalent metal cation (Fe/Co/Zn/Cd) transporter